MAQFDLEKHALVGAGGLLSVREDDEITRKLSMLIEGECEGLPHINDRLATQMLGCDFRVCRFSSHDSLLPS